MLFAFMISKAQTEDGMSWDWYDYKLVIGPDFKRTYNRTRDLIDGLKAKDKARNEAQWYDYSFKEVDYIEEVA
jgi:hypothetical protein